MINNLDDFFSEIKKEFQFIVVDNSEDDFLIKNYIKENFERKNTYKLDNTNIVYFENLRQIFRHISHGNDINEYCFLKIMKFINFFK